jgi:hypothetical protein
LQELPKQLKKNKMNKTLLAMIFSSLLWPVIADAQSCDFDKIVGTCTANYVLQNVRNDPNKVNSAAEVKVTSSGGECSKVTFYVDSTPYLSVFDHKSTVVEQIFGTTTIASQSVSIDSCQTYATKDDSKKDNSEEKGTSDDTGEVSKMFNDAEANPNFDPAESDARFDQLIGGGSSSNQANDGSSGDGASSGNQILGAFLSVLGGAAQGLSAVQAANGVRAAAAAAPIVTKMLPAATAASVATKPNYSAPTQQFGPAPTNVPGQGGSSSNICISNPNAVVNGVVGWCYK